MSNQNDMARIQEIVDELRKTPYKRYVEERKLHLINDELAVIDNLLEQGLVK